MARSKLPFRFLPHSITLRPPKFNLESPTIFVFQVVHNLVPRALSFSATGIPLHLSPSSISLPTNHLCLPGRPSVSVSTGRLPFQSPSRFSHS